MSSLAAILLGAGKTVSGCDQTPNAVTAILEAKGARVRRGHSAAHLEGVDRVVVTGPALGRDEVRRARERGLPVVRRAELLGQLMDERRGVAVAGTHGKTTTTSLLAALVLAGGLDPTVLIGGVPAGWELGGRYGSGAWMVAEADEYDRSFLTLHPEIAVVTSIEMDHPDIYADLGDVKAAFAAFLGGVRPAGTVLVCVGHADAVVVARGAAERCGLRLLTYGRGADAEYRPEEVTAEDGSTRFALRHPGGTIPDLHLALPGGYNLDNACGAAAAALLAGVPADAIRAGLESVRGVGRRWETKGEARGVLVVDDYAHHPAEAERMLRSARERYPERTLWVAFQPHTYSRTRALLPDFARALSVADRAYVLDVYAAREAPDPDVSGPRLAELVPGAVYAGGVDTAAVRLAADARPGVLLVTMGAGDVTALGPLVLARLGEGAR